MNAALRFDHISAGYGTSPVLFDVDLVVPPGTAVALLGANGAGKTTLLRTGAGLLRPSRGDVWMDGERVTHLSEYARARHGLSLVPEGHAIFRQLSVKENLAMFVHGKAVHEAVERAASFFPKLGQRLAQDAGTLSGGEQQMLALARALVTDPKVILADELSLGLAPVVIDEIFEAVQALRAEGRSLLIVEQYAARALDIADYVYILHKGAVAFVGEPAQCADEHIFERYLGSVA